MLNVRSPHIFLWHPILLRKEVQDKLHSLFSMRTKDNLDKMMLFSCRSDEVVLPGNTLHCHGTSGFHIISDIITAFKQLTVFWVITIISLEAYSSRFLTCFRGFFIRYFGASTVCHATFRSFNQVFTSRGRFGLCFNVADCFSGETR